MKTEHTEAKTVTDSSVGSGALLGVLGWIFELFRPRGTWAENETGVRHVYPSERDPIKDTAREVLWWSYFNQYGTHMIRVVDQRNGWSVESNQFHGRLPDERELDELVAFLRSPPNNQVTGAAQPRSV